MSYILDALEKSQKQREESDIPGLDNVHVLSKPQKDEPTKGGRRWVFITLPLLVIAVAGGWWLAGYSPEDQSGSIVSAKDSRNSVPGTTVEETQITAKPVESAVVDLVAEDQPVRADTPVKVETQPNTEETSVQAQAGTEQGIVSETVSSEVLPPVVQITQVDEPINTKIPLQGNQSKEIASEDTPEQQSSPSQVIANESAEKAVEKPLAEPIPHYRALPFDIQQKIPEIRYSVHLYSPIPENRMVKIDGWVRKEGSTVYPEVKLLEITEKGAIFQYRDYKFRMPVN